MSVCMFTNNGRQHSCPPSLRKSFGFHLPVTGIFRSYWGCQWDARVLDQEYYYIKQEDLEYAISHNLCTVLILNKSLHDGTEKLYVFSEYDHA